MDKRILAINPGSTSTKLALFQGEQKLFDAAVRHSKEDLSPFSWVMEQADFRQTAIEKELSAHNVDLTTLDAVCAVLSPSTRTPTIEMPRASRSARSWRSRPPPGGRG